MTRRIAIIGGGIAGVTAAWQLARLAAEGTPVDVILFEATNRLGGIVETVRRDNFVMECGPDGWVTEKPWARELAEELGLAGQLIYSNDATRKTYVLQQGKLVVMPDAMRMMVPRGMAGLASVNASPLFSKEAKAAFHAEVARAEELKASAADTDESVASFVQRHFGLEVLEKIGAPLLGGVFGGDVTKLSVRAVMAPFVALEREHGSLILGLERATQRKSKSALFTSLRTGAARLIDRMIEDIPLHWIRLQTPVSSIKKTSAGWAIQTPHETAAFDQIIIAAPVHIARTLLQPIDEQSAALMNIEATSAVVAAFAFTEPLNLPLGFGFLVPPGSPESRLLAATFVDQKYPHRAPAGSHLLRAFFGGASADDLLNATDHEIAHLAISELQQILGPLPTPDITVVRRWPKALPQYDVGHLERMTELFARIKHLGNLHLLGNGYHGVGLSDLIRDSRSAARSLSLEDQRP